MARGAGTRKEGAGTQQEGNKREKGDRTDGFHRKSGFRKKIYDYATAFVTHPISMETKAVCRHFYLRMGVRRISINDLQE